MTDSRPLTLSKQHAEQEQKKRKRERFLILVIISIVILLTFVENRIIYFGTDFPISNTILMFTLININLLLLILLIFLVFRNLVKLFYDRKRKVIGSKLKNQTGRHFHHSYLAADHYIILFFINFITNSIEFWFNVPIEQALENSLLVGRRIYQHSEDSNRFFLERIAYQIKNKKLLDPDENSALANYIQVVQREFNIYGVEAYDINANRLTYALTERSDQQFLQVLSADHLQKAIQSKGIKTISQIIPNGELIRTIGTVPFQETAEKIEAFVVLSLFIPPGLSEKMESISRGFEEYQQIKLLKSPSKAPIISPFRL